MISINMDKAKEIQKQKIRAERAEILNQLDVQFMRAVESGDQVKMQEIAAKKQTLRDAPQHSLIVDAETPEQLKQATITAILGE